MHLESLIVVLGSMQALIFAVYFDEPFLAAAAAAGVFYAIEDMVGPSWPFTWVQRYGLPNFTTPQIAGGFGVTIVFLSRFVIGDLDQ